LNISLNFDYQNNEDKIIVDIIQGLELSHQIYSDAGLNFLINLEENSFNLNFKENQNAIITTVNGKYNTDSNFELSVYPSV